MADPNGQIDESVNVIEENKSCNDGIKGYLPARFECPICLTCLREPVLTSCGHKFCSHCIHMWLEREGGCPVDSKPLKKDSDLFRDLYTSREISQLRMTCPYRQFGCDIELSPTEMEKHTTECLYRRDLPELLKLQCYFKDVGCTEVPETEEALRAHLEQNINSHLIMVANALPQLNGSGNVTVQAVSEVSKLWDPPPKNGLNSEKKDCSVDCDQLMKNLYERIVVLEQQNRELSITIANQKTQLTTLQTSIRFNQEEMSLRNCNGVYIWRLSAFKDKLSAMVNDPLKMFYSPGFYTSYNGYKICARINVSSKDPNYLSLVLHIMKSESDDALDWPFNGTMYFVLFHPYDSEKDIREITSSRPDVEAFRRPTFELNKRSFGYTEFVRISDVTDYLRDDCLTLRLEVRAYDKFKVPAV